MGIKQVETMKEKMAGFIAFAKAYPEIYRATIVDNLCKAQLADDGAGYTADIAPEIENKLATNEHRTQEEGSDQWDYRKEMLTLARDRSVDVKKIAQQHFVAALAFVLEVRCPKGKQAPQLTPDLLVDACRAAGRKLPKDAGSTLRAAKSRGLLDKKRGETGFRLAPAGENFVNELLSARG